MVVSSANFSTDSNTFLKSAIGIYEEVAITTQTLFSYNTSQNSFL